MTSSTYTPADRASAVAPDSPVVVIGAGQAGLAVSHELSGHGVDHVVLERRQVGQSWRDRWDSFRLVTPNWTMSLPGSCYAGEDPEGFVSRDEIVGYLERYAAGFGAPVYEGVGVDGLEPGSTSRFLLRTTAGDMQAHSVVVCSGAYQRPHRPDGATRLPPGVLGIDAEDYRNPAALSPGRVLVIGSGQTGCQIAEELHEADRDVFLACGRAPWVPRRPSGRDIVSWLNETTFFDLPLGALPSPTARLIANLQATGQRGGHDLHYRTLQAMGVQLLGRLAGVEGHRAYFANDLADSVAFGDSRYADIQTTTHRPARRQGDGHTRTARPATVSRHSAAGARPARIRHGGLHLGLSPRLRALGALPRVRRHGLPAHRGRCELGGPRPVLLRRPLPA